MPKEAAKAHLTLALNTTLEREFVSPLTSIRGALEIMRDFPDLSDEERSRFIKNVLQDCARLERGVEHLTETVYAAVDSNNQDQSQAAQVASDSGYADRIQFFEELQVVEIDFSDFVFTSSKVVNDFYDLLDQLIESTGQRWYVVVNYHHCRIWPEAWVAFAHRGKKVNLSYSLGSVRYFDASAVDEDLTLLNDPQLLSSRDAAMAHVEALRRAARDR
jgi:signal transduction histidine kinase